VTGRLVFLPFNENADNPSFSAKVPVKKRYLFRRVPIKKQVPAKSQAPFGKGAYKKAGTCF
jgi:hypothetical protein